MPPAVPFSDGIGHEKAKSHGENSLRGKSSRKNHDILFSSRLYCRPRSLTESCPKGLAGYTAGGESHPALKRCPIHVS